MFRQIVPLLAALLGVAPGLVGQSRFIPSDTPTTGPCNITPFGAERLVSPWANQKYQCMATAAELGGRAVGRITDLGFAPCSAAVGSIHFDSIEVVLAQTSASVLATKFSKNLSGNVKTVLKATNYDWDVVGGEWNRLGLDLPYTYDSAAYGQNLVIQITVTGCYKTGAVSTGFHRGVGQRVFSMGWATSVGPGNFGVVDAAALKFEVGFDVGALTFHGIGCRGSSGLAPTLQMVGDPEPGGSIFVFVSRCASNASSLHVLGLTRMEPQIPLAVIGAPTCSLFTSTDVLLPTQADVTGQYFLVLQVPNDKAFISRSFFTQGFPLDAKANAWGRTASSYGRILIGN